MNVLPLESRVRIASALVEGVSIRGTERLTGVTKKTIARLGLALGDGCARLHDRLVRNVSPAEIQMDEIWSFIHTKEARVNPAKDPPEWGDCYTWVALDPLSKLVVSYLVGKRDGEHANRFAVDLRKRVLAAPHIQLSSDGLLAYIDAIKAAFGWYDFARGLLSFGQVIKSYKGGPQSDDHRYEPPRKMAFVTKMRVFGEPDFSRMSTSLVERQNLTMRMHIRRLTRLTNAFSKRARSLRAAVALHFMWYNFCRVHETLRVTPAMQAGLSDHLWTLVELVEAAVAEADHAVPPPPPQQPPPDGPDSDLGGDPTTRTTYVQLDLFGQPMERIIKRGKTRAANDVEPVGEMADETAEEAPPTERGTSWGWGQLQAGSNGVG